jgi:hypothetical protein
VLRPALLALLPWLAVALAREVEAALGLVLHTGLREPQIPSAALRALDPAALLRTTLAFVLLGAALWIALAGERARREGGGWRAALVAEGPTFLPLWLLPLTTFLALLALAGLPSWPYRHTLAVALTQDLRPARDVLVLAALAAGRVLPLRLPPPGAGGVFFVSFLAYALLTPDWARRWDNHPGNEPKYLRMAVALSHRLSLDVEPVSAPMEELTPEPLATAALGAARGLLGESSRMLGALLRGPRAVGREAIAATRLTRQTVRGKEGGVFHVLAPGPSLLLAPALRVDRALNRSFATPGRLAVSVLAMNGLGALLVAAVFLLVREATGRAGLSAALAFAFALLPPFLFYFFQFYPEMPGALALALIFRCLFFRDRTTVAAAWGLGLLLAFLPWLHQKFLPVWLVLAATAVVQAWRRDSPRGVLAGLLLPQLASLYLTALYNFAVTGSVRPDALYLAWGPAGVTTARMGQGLLGLWLDARYGLLPMVPVYALAVAGPFLKGEAVARLRWALPGAGVYYLTVASADNWAGAVCNLGRYLMPILPLVIALVAVVVGRTAARRGALAVVLLLLGLSGLLAHALWSDPHAANDSALLLAKSRFADGALYIPGLTFRAWSEAAPGLFLRIAVWLAFVVGLAVWLARVAAGKGGARPLRAACAALGLALAAAALLQRSASSRSGPVFPATVDLSDGRAVFLEGPVQGKDDLFEVQAGETTVFLRARGEQESARVTLLAGGTGLVEWPGGAPLALRPQGALLELPLDKAVVVADRDGGSETLLRQRLRVSGEAPIVLRFPEAESVEPRPPEER